MNSDLLNQKLVCFEWVSLDYDEYSIVKKYIVMPKKYTDKLFLEKTMREYYEKMFLQKTDFLQQIYKKYNLLEISVYDNFESFLENHVWEKYNRFDKVFFINNFIKDVSKDVTDEVLSILSLFEEELKKYRPTIKMVKIE